MTKKIGGDTLAKQEEKEAYVAIGLVKLEPKGYGVAVLKMSGTEVLSRKIVRKADTLAAALMEYQVESGSYQIKYLDKEIK
jgi:hypothetical protein